MDHWRKRSVVVEENLVSCFPEDIGDNFEVGEDTVESWKGRGSELVVRDEVNLVSCGSEDTGDSFQAWEDMFETCKEWVFVKTL
jgi:hypothetical protein